MDNDGIPFVEGTSTTEARLTLADPTHSPSADAFIALQWTHGQTHPSLTGLRVYIENEEGTSVLLDSTGVIGAATSNYVQPLLSIQETRPFSDSMEGYLAEVNGEPVLPESTYWHGAENFTRARVTSLTHNDGSQVPGGYTSTSHEALVVLNYRSQYGWGVPGGRLPGT